MSAYDDALTTAEQRYGLPTGLLHGLMHTESRGDPKAVSRKGAVGLMQFMPATAKQYGIDPTDPMQSIDGAARLMRDNLKAAHGDVAEALRIYQGGTNKAARGPENAAYAGKVLGAMPGDSGDLAAMGFNAPASVDTPDLSSAGLSTSPDADVKAARAELDKFSATPAPNQMTQDVNAIIKGGVANGHEVSRIKQDVAVYWAKQGRDPTKSGTGIDGAINYYRHNGAGVVPVVIPTKVAPLNRLQKVRAGLKQGVEDVDATFDPMAQAIARKVPGLDRLGNNLGFATADQAAGVHSQDRTLFNATLGNDTLANVGRVGGNVAASAPLILGGNALAGRVAAELPEAAAPVTSFLAGKGGSNLLTKGASLATHGAAEGVMGSAAVSGGNDAPLMDQLESGGIAGALLGPGGKLLSKAGGAAVGALAPKVNPIVAQLAQKAVDMGIDVRGSQISGSPFVRTVDSVLARVPGSGMAADNAAQREQFTRAVGKTFGADGPALTPDVMSRAKSAISNVYNDVGNRTTLDVSPDRGSSFISNLDQIASDARGVLDTNKLPALDRLIENVKDKISEDGTIAGKVFKTLTSKGSMLDQATQDGNGSFANAAKAIKAHLNDALEASATPEDAAALARADWQWKNMRTVEKLIANSPDGSISPAALQRPVSTSFKNRAYTGAGDLGDLADIGQRFLKDSGSSNTAERHQILEMIAKHGAGFAGGMGTVLGYHAGLEPLTAAGTGLAALAGASGVGKATTWALTRDAYRNRLLNAALDSDPTGGVVAPWLAQNFTPLAVAGGNRLLQPPPPAGR